MSLQFRRGASADRTSITPVAGEPIFTTDTKKLYIGDGTTAGGVEVGGGSSAPNFAVAIATTEGFGLGDWSKVTVGQGTVVPWATTLSSLPPSAHRVGVLALRTNAVNDVATIGGGESVPDYTTFSPLSSALLFTRMTAYIYPLPLPAASSAVYAFGVNTWGPNLMDFDDGNGSGDTGLYFRSQSGNWHISYRGLNPNTAAFQVYSFNTNVPVSNAWTRFDLEFTRVEGSPPDLSIVAKINGTTVANTLASTIESSQAMELRGVLSHLIPFIGQKRTAGSRNAHLLVDNFTLYSEVTR
jgi:hypothetical protein